MASPGGSKQGFSGGGCDEVNASFSIDVNSRSAGTADVHHGRLVIECGDWLRL